MKRDLLKLKISFILCIVFTFSITGLGYAQEEEIAKYPNRPITHITTISPGGTTDLICRLLCKHAEKFFGQPIVIINKPNVPGNTDLAKAKPDGYTFGFISHSSIFMQPFVEKVPYDVLTDFTYLLQYTTHNMGVVVQGNSPFNTFSDLIAYARQNPKKVTVGTTGPSYLQHNIMELIAKREKVQFTHIPFQNNPQMQQALLGGHIVCGAGDYNYSMIEAKQFKVLLIFRQEQSAEYPEVQVLKDLGYADDIPVPMFMGITGPKGIPDGIMKKIDAAFTQAMKEPAFIKGMKEDIHYPIVYRNHKEITDYVVRNYEFFRKYLKEVGIAKY